MNNEIVAWIGKNELQFGFTETTVTSEKESWDDIPLYTHPADLTDEYCKAYWGKDSCFVDVFLPNSETEVIRFWNDQLNESYKPKTLTDEEILQIWKEFDDNDADNWFIEIAKAILRKAQEK